MQELKSVVKRLKKLEGLEHSITTEILYLDTERVVIQSQVSCDDKLAHGTAMVERINADQYRDYSYVQTAETLAVGRALGFMFPDESICSEEEAQRNKDMGMFDDRKKRSEAATETLINKLKKKDE